jgi:nitrate reductase NapAB chaperone NapD
MIIASMIVKTEIEKVNDIVLQLNKLPNVTTHGIFKENNIIVLVEAESNDKLRDIGRYISSEFDGVFGTYPTFVSADEDIKAEAVN